MLDLVCFYINYPLPQIKIMEECKTPKHCVFYVYNIAYPSRGDKGDSDVVSFQIISNRVGKAC